MAADPDGDSEMASSSESDNVLSDDSGPDSRTPTKIRPGFAASELSPPGSQTQASGESNTETSFGKIIGAATSGSATQEEQLGASWMTKRAEEEYQRAWEYVIDRDLSLNEFGDIFDESDMSEKLL
ncbi:hypothetical protein ASPZODRAFT_157806 [Penicilliopsis zonata CBS 506.65]|uniref:Uncharacterized protein n=1 Tax=Penicilliopsis zonata CBS 506.65 TaxID=1073090 RepID=A0A1L9SQ91_9EURO|nr:hypothetical protein ASPZODRAFT_157806 [Penicilliopsis zonata CBS 506.65]OJJ49412.1 hypothetical protein ASPZODRAFT_157806 [Penicilliopsis zonata CBS 506.65]